MVSGKWIKVAGTYLRYELVGEGVKTLVLVHEMGGSLETWDLLMPQLTQNFRVLRFDLRGTGLSEKFRGPISLETLAGDVHSLLTALDISEPVILVGASIGCAVAISYASLHPGRVAAMVLFSPVTEPPRMGVEAALKLIKDIEINGVGPYCDELVAAHYGGVYPPQSVEDKDFVVQINAQFASNDPVCLAETWRLMTRLNLEPLLSSIRCPCLIVAGHQDKWRDAADLRALASRFPNGQFALVDGGHYMLLRNVDLVMLPLRFFLGTA